MRRLIPLLAIGLTLGACHHLKHGSPPLTLGSADSGRAIEMTVGQIATVRLTADPATGYRWQITTDPDARTLIVVDSGYDRPLPASPGTPGQAWWKLRVTGAGSTTFSVRYVRPWEQDDKAQEFRVTVNVGIPDLAHQAVRFRS